MGRKIFLTKWGNARFVDMKFKYGTLLDEIWIKPTGQYLASLNLSLLQ